MFEQLGHVLLAHHPQRDCNRAQRRADLGLGLGHNRVAALRRGRTAARMGAMPRRSASACLLPAQPADQLPSSPCRRARLPCSAAPCEVLSQHRATEALRVHCPAGLDQAQLAGTDVSAPACRLDSWSSVVSRQEYSSGRSRQCRICRMHRGVDARQAGGAGGPRCGQAAARLKAKRLAAACNKQAALMSAQDGRSSLCSGLQGRIG